MSREYSQDVGTKEPRFLAASRTPTPHSRHLKKKPERRSLVFLLLAPTLALLAAFSLSLGIAQAASTLPQASPITITSETQTFTYATQITFQVSASDTAGKIASAQLEIMVQPVGIDRHINVPVAEPGSSVTLSYRYDASSDYLPPYSPITYRWTLSDNAQHSLTGAAQRFDFADTRFDWQHLTQSGISIYWYGQDAAYGQNILTTAAQEAASIAQDFNGTLTDPLKVIVYASNKDLQGGLPANSPNWAGGVALIPFDEALIVLGENSYALQRDLPHELTHLILHQIAGLNCGGCPLWFDEGMAVYHQIYHEPEMQFAFENAVKNDKLLPFKSLTDRFPDDTDQAEIAYAQSWNYLKYLYRTYTQPNVARLVNALRTDNFASAFQRAFGAAPDQMENKWRASLGLEPANDTPQSTPSTSGSPTSGQPSGVPGSQNNSGIVNALAIIVFLLLASGLVTAIFLMRRGQAPAPASEGAPWGMPGVGMPGPFTPMQPSEYQTGYAAPPLGIATDQRYQGQIAQRQALLHSIEDALAREKYLRAQQAELERQRAFYLAQEQQAHAEGSEQRAMLALDRRLRLESQLPALQQQLAQVQQQRMAALHLERRISAEIDAAFSQQAVLASQAAPMHAWPQPPRRRISQD